MVEVKNIQIFNLEGAMNAINASYAVGEINTLKEPSDRIKGVATALGSNMASHQSHDAFLKGILVRFDIKCNLVFQPEFQRYHFVEIIMQQSRMHSMEKFMNGTHDPFTKYVTQPTRDEVKRNYEAWVKAKEGGDKHKIYTAFETLVHNLPCGFELWASCTTNYLQLKTIVIQRFHHKNIEDWRAVVEACYSMPQFRELCGFTSKSWDLSEW